MAVNVDALLPLALDHDRLEVYRTAVEHAEPHALDQAENPSRKEDSP